MCLILNPITQSGAALRKSTVRTENNEFDSLFSSCSVYFEDCKLESNTFYLYIAP